MPIVLEITLLNKKYSPSKIEYVDNFPIKGLDFPNNPFLKDIEKLIKTSIPTVDDHDYEFKMEDAAEPSLKKQGGGRGRSQGRNNNRPKSKSSSSRSGGNRNRSRNSR